MRTLHATLLLLVACKREPDQVTAIVSTPPTPHEQPVVAGELRAHAHALADLDGDGTLELSAGGFVTSTSRRRATVFVYRRTGDRWLPVTDGGWLGGGGGNGSTVRNVEVADLDGDGKPEVIALGRVGSQTKAASARLVVLALQDGKLRELARVEWNAATYTHGFGLAIGDLDGDHRPEIVTSGFFFDGTVEHGFVRSWSYAGNALTLRAEQRLPGTLDASVRINDVAIGDIDGDGRIEVVTAGRTSPYRAEKHDLDERDEHGDLAVFDGTTLLLRTRTSWRQGATLRLRAVDIANLDDEDGAEIVTGGQFDPDGKPCLAVFDMHDGAIAMRTFAAGEGAGEIKDVFVEDSQIIASGPVGTKAEHRDGVTKWRLVDDQLVLEQKDVAVVAVVGPHGLLDIAWPPPAMAMR
jgi:hypothetical protein